METINIRKSYNYYKIRVEEAIPIKTYIYIANGFMKFLMTRILSGKDIQLPGGMGSVGVRGTKRSPKVDANGNICGLPPNWKATKELWSKDPKAKEEKQIIYYFNEKTQGIIYRLVWFRANEIFENKTMYSIKLQWGNKKLLSQSILSKTEYLLN